MGEFESAARLHSVVEPLLPSADPQAGGDPAGDSAIQGPVSDPHGD